MFHKVKNVKALQKFILEITFDNNEIKFFDVQPLINKFIIFQDLKNVYGLFENVKVDIGGYGISWNDEIDLSCEELYINGKSKI